MLGDGAKYFEAKILQLCDEQIMHRNRGPAPIEWRMACLRLSLAQAAVFTSYGTKYILCCRPIWATRAIAFAGGRREKGSF